MVRLDAMPTQKLARTLCHRASAACVAMVSTLRKDVPHQGQSHPGPAGVQPHHSIMPRAAISRLFPAEGRGWSRMELCLNQILLCFNSSSAVFNHYAVLSFSPCHTGTCMYTTPTHTSVSRNCYRNMSMHFTRADVFFLSFLPVFFFEGLPIKCSNPMSSTPHLVLPTLHHVSNYTSWRPVLSNQRYKQ